MTPGAAAIAWARARHHVRRLTGRPVLTAAVVGALAVAGSAALGFGVRMPQPEIADEFSYLLAADTFAHGRLTNPTHPMWVHFESFHVIQQPSYMSKYPPAQGLALAAGQVLFGRPIVGVWLTAGLACGALTWMLAGWMPGRWALAGGLLALVHPLTLGWSQSYWGGLVAVLGGSLVLGAFRRLVRRPRPRHALVLGAGLVILANSRPYEGVVLSLPLLAALGLWLGRGRAAAAGVSWARLAIPLGAVLAVAGAWMLYYDYRVTGDPLTLPYMVHDRTYATTPLFLFLPPKPLPAYRHARLRQFELEVALPPYHTQRTWAGLEDGVRWRLGRLAGWYFGGLLVVALCAFRLPLERDGWHHLALLVLGLFLVALSATVHTTAHYAAPAAGLALLLTLRALRGLGAWRPAGRRVGRALAAVLWLLLLGSLAQASWTTIREWRATGWPYARARLADDLRRTGERHLVVVRYAPSHSIHAEWVYNAADIDTAPVVWAHEMDAAATARLLDYFRDRRVWLLEPDRAGDQLVPYPGPSGAGGPTHG